MPGTTPGRKTFVFLIVYLTGSTPFAGFPCILDIERSSGYEYKFNICL